MVTDLNVDSPELPMLSHRPRLCVGVLAWACAISFAAWAQESVRQGFYFVYDDDHRVVSVGYHGSSGLRSAQLDQFPRLERVDISYGTVLTYDDIAYLSTLSNLAELAIGQDTIDTPLQIESDLLPLRNLKSLEFLHLCKHDIQDDDLRFVAALPNLRGLRFNASGELDSRRYSVTDRCADYLAQATTLEAVWVGGCWQLTDDFVSRLTTGTRDLMDIDLHSPHLTDESLRLLAERCKNLRCIDMGSDHFTDAGVKHLSSLKTLKQLSLASPQLTHACIESIAELEQLSSFGLTVPEITDEGVQTIAGLSELASLHLGGPPLTDSQFAMFRHHPTLESAFINGIQLSEQELLDTVGTIPNLMHLDVGRGNPHLQAVVKREMDRRKPVD